LARTAKTQVWSTRLRMPDSANSAHTNRPESAAVVHGDALRDWRHSGIRRASGAHTGTHKVSAQAITKKMRVRATNYRSIWCRESRKQSKCARAHVVQGGRDSATCTSSSPARTTARQRASPRSRCRQMRCRKNKSWATSYREICREHDGAEYMVPAAVQEAARGRRQAAGGTKLSTEAARKKRTLCAAGELPSKCS